MLVNNRQLFTTVVNVEPFDYDLRFAGHAARPRNLTNGTAEDLGIFLYERGNGQDLQIDSTPIPAHVHRAGAGRSPAPADRLHRRGDPASPQQAVGHVDLLEAPRSADSCWSDWNDTAHAGARHAAWSR